MARPEIIYLLAMVETGPYALNEKGFLTEQAQADLCQQFGIAKESLEPGFSIGPVTFPPDAPKYTLRIERSAAVRAQRDFPDIFILMQDPELGRIPNDGSCGIGLFGR